MKGINIYHICNLSPLIIFRDVEDFLLAISRLAACSCRTSVQILAYSIMSTHFHLIIRGREEEKNEFDRLYKRSIGMLHNKKYRTKVQVRTSCKRVVGDEHITSVINYVLKNPIHHGVKSNAFSYPYSSTNCYFHEDFDMGERFPGEKDEPFYLKPSELDYRDSRRIFGTNTVPDSYKILYKRTDSGIYHLVLPESFIDIKSVETIYSSSRNFAYQMNKPLKEDIEMFGDDIDAIYSHSSKGELTGQISDIRACKIMDEYIFPKSYAEIALDKKTALWKYLKGYGVNYGQFQRMAI